MPHRLMASVAVLFTLLFSRYALRGRFECEELPQLQALLFGEIHLVARLHIESLIPHVDVGKGTIDTPFTNRVRIALRADSNFLFCDILSPYTSIRDEEPLISRKDLFYLEGLRSRSILIGIPSHLETPVKRPLALRSGSTLMPLKKSAYKLARSSKPAASAAVHQSCM